MAANSIGLSVAKSASKTSISSTEVTRTRRLDRESGRALEILGHAIEYLADEYIPDGQRLDPRDAQVKAVQILMALSREIYNACPPVRSLFD